MVEMLLHSILVTSGFKGEKFQSFLSIFFTDNYMWSSMVVQREVEWRCGNCESSMSFTVSLICSLLQLPEVIVTSFIEFV